MDEKYKVSWDDCLLTEGYEDQADMPDLRAGQICHSKIEQELGDVERDMMQELRILTGLEKTDSLKQESNLVDKLLESAPTKRKARRKRREVASQETGWHERAKYLDFDAIDDPADEVPARPILEQYKACTEGTIRREWADKAEKNELSSSGMPTYMQMIAEGKEDQYDEEMLKYCNLAGLKYVTTKAKMKQEVEDITNKLRHALWDAESRLEKLVESFKQMEVC